MRSLVGGSPDVGAVIPLVAQEEPSDEALLELYAISDPDASAAFVARFQGRVFGVACTILGDGRAAEDVAQEALIRAGRHAGAFDRRRGSVKTWLSTITRNLAIDAMRARRSIAVDPDDLTRLITTLERDPADVAVVHDDIDRLRDALTRLPEEQRRAVVLAGVWGVTAREIAEREGIPLGTAKTRIRTALGRLRDAMREHPTH
jgi:RNA polymerase sigma factor (sigma-70 family)